MRRCALFALACLIALVAGAASASAASAKPLYGVQGVSIRPGVTQAELDATLTRASQLHAKVLRLNVPWAAVEPLAPGVHDPAVVASIDHFVAGAHQRKIKVLLLVATTPCWASTAPDKGDCSAPDANRDAVTRYPPADPQSYVEIATFLAGRYQADLAGFEVWNEPDQANELYWAGPNKVARYVALAKAVYTPLKRAAPKVPVLAGAFVGVDGKWLQALYDAGLKGYYDALSVHFYDLPLYGLTTTRQVQRRNHDSKPIWLAEFGFSSCLTATRKTVTDHACLSRTGQARALTDTLREVARVPWVKAAIVYQLDDETQDYQFGLTSPSGARKPAFAAVRNVFLGHKVKVTKPTLRLAVSGRKVIVRATGSWVDLFLIKVKIGGAPRYQAYARVGQTGTLRLALPAQLGTHLTVTLAGGWTGTVTRSR